MPDKRAIPFKQRIAEAIERQWYQSTAGWLWLLFPLEWLFRAIVRSRRKNLVPLAYLPPIPTIIIGNVTVGGTGKTPLLIALVKYLQSHGYSPGVVSRGHGRKGTLLSVVDMHSTAEDVGDEPLLLFQQTGCPVAVHEDRTKAAKALIEYAPIDIILADDGLQHYRLGRHFEIGVVDATRLFGNRHCLPLGPLREPLARLSQLNCIVLTSLSPVDNAALEHVPNMSAPMFNAVTEPIVWRSLDGDVTRPLDAFCHEEVVAIAGIGNPDKFYQTLAQLGMRFSTLSFPDHHAYRAEDFSFHQENALRQPCVMTSKDAIKCQNLGLVNCWYLDIDVVLSDDFLQYFMQCLAYLLEGQEVQN